MIVSGASYLLFPATNMYNDVGFEWSKITEDYRVYNPCLWQTDVRKNSDIHFTRTIIWNKSSSFATCN